MVTPSFISTTSALRPSIRASGSLWPRGLAHQLKSPQDASDFALDPISDPFEVCVAGGIFGLDHGFIKGLGHAVIEHPDINVLMLFDFQLCPLGALTGEAFEGRDQGLSVLLNAAHSCSLSHKVTHVYSKSEFASDVQEEALRAERPTGTATNSI